MRKPPRLYIDTNIVGEIALDADRDRIIQEMRHRFDVRIGVLVIAEISCIKDRRERCRWLDTARRVTGGAKNPPFDDPRSITRRHIASFARGDTSVDPFIDRRDGPKALIWELLKNPESMTERQHLTFREIRITQSSGSIKSWRKCAQEFRGLETKTETLLVRVI